MMTYLETIYQAMWAWAEIHHDGELDGGRQQRRPPVLKPDFAAKNVLVPSDVTRAEEIRGLIRPAQRHRHFSSLRSSQALAQSVFGAMSTFGRLELLARIPAECGRPAFFEEFDDWKIALEHDVDTLGEPRSTSVDVLLSGPARQVAIECKFTEAEFGTCSRPRLRPGDGAYSEQRCDGNYRVQEGRSDRCALTAIGVKYWDHLPKLFAWPADYDHEPCPLRAAYQLARNALAAVVTADGNVDLDRGHALILYDARNPAFQPGGAADRQLQDAINACLVPGLLRCLSWQRLITSIATAPDLTWLLDALRDKYALVPSDCGIRLGG